LSEIIKAEANDDTLGPPLEKYKMEVIPYMPPQAARTVQVKQEPGTQGGDFTRVKSEFSEDDRAEDAKKAKLDIKNSMLWDELNDALVKSDPSEETKVPKQEPGQGEDSGNAEMAGSGIEVRTSAGGRFTVLIKKEDPDEKNTALKTEL
jgi:hypothetical protein